MTNPNNPVFTSFRVAVATVFIACVAVYIGWRIWKFERFWAYFIPQFVLASALAVELARGGRLLERWLTVVIATFFSAGFAVSCFRMSFYTYPDGSTAPELIIPGIGFSLCAIALVVSEVILHLRQKEMHRVGRQFDMQDGTTHLTSEENRNSGKP